MPQVFTAIAKWVGGKVAGGILSAGGTAAKAVAWGTIAATATEALLYVGTAKVLSALGGSENLPTPDYSGTTYKQAIPERLRAFGTVRSGGPYMLFAADAGVSHDVVAVHDGEIDSVLAYYLNDDEVTLSSDLVVSPDGRKYGESNNLVLFQTRTGLATETVYSGIATALPTLWSSAHRGDGIASLYLKSTMPSADKYNATYPNGLPMPSVVFKAQKVFDWRDVAQDIDDATTWEWSDNPIVCLASYLCNDMGMAFETVIEPNLDYWTDAADVCEELISTPDGSEVRFSLNMRYFVTNSASAVISAILQNCGGYLADDGRGGLKVWAGVWADPEVTIDDSEDIIDAYYFERGGEAENEANAFDISFTNSLEKYNTGDAGRWRNEDAITAAGQVRATSLDLTTCLSPWQAQRCAKLHDRKINSRLRGHIIGGLSLIQCIGERIITLNISDNDALNGITIMPTKIEVLDLMAGKIKVNFIALSETDFDFDTGTEYLDIDYTASGGTGEGPDDYITNLTVSSINVPLGASNGVYLGVSVAATSSNYTFEYQYRLTSSSTWLDFTGGYGVQFVMIGPLTNGATYEARARVTSYGWYSDWTAPENVTLEAINAPNGQMDGRDPYATGLSVVFEIDEETLG